MKKCKGTSKTKGYGCGTKLPFTERNGLKTYKQKYGLGYDCGCFSKWVISTSEGDKFLNNTLASNKKKFEKEKKDKWNKEKLDIKKQLESKTYLENKLQKEINLIVRLIDKGHKCISSGRELGKNYDAGHLYTVGSNPTIRFHLFNIFAQSVHDNQHKSGNELQFFLRLKEVFSKDFQDFVLSLKQIPSIHLSKDDLRDKTMVARSLVKWLKLQDKTYTTEERISLRTDFNNSLAIYPQEFCEFKL